jgi:hypothetical protein
MATHTPSPAQPAATQHQGYTMRTNDHQRAQFAAIAATPRIAELDQPAEVPTVKEVPLEEALYPIVDQHQVLIVAGALDGPQPTLFTHSVATAPATGGRGSRTAHGIEHPAAAELHPPSHSATCRQRERHGWRGVPSI